jgi:ABC-type bacteriocin/lantibiotic exporter with double-glycine peptidase domain
VGAERADTLGLALLCALGASLALGGCYAGTAHAISPHEVAADPGWVMVSGVPLVRQSGGSDCGAAALAMVLGYWERPLTVAEINARDPQAAAHGWKASQLRDLAREKGLRSFAISGRLADLSKEVGQGRPVIVGLVKRYGDKALAHYQVVVGIHPQKRRILSLDPNAGWREDSLEGFAREWVPTQQATLVFLPPGAPTSPPSAATVPALPPGSRLQVQRSPGAS